MSRYGLGSVGATLAARILTLPANYILTNAAPFPGMHAIYILPLHAGLPYGVVYDFNPILHPHFPYGRSVEPDAPL